jgi:RNA polymerase sigma-70 factor (ECF subfamily)
MTDESEGMGARLAAARAGSTQALGEVFEACRGYLLLVAREQLDPDLQAKGGASDLVQETFLEAQRDFLRFQGTSEAELLAWLRRLLLNNVANFARHFRATSKRSIARERPLDAGDSGPGLAERLASESVSPSGEAAANEQEGALRRALERLPEDYRQVILLRHEEGKSLEEIATLLGRSYNAVRKLWARALDRLQDELGPPP